MIGVYEVRTKAPSSAAAFDRRYRRRALRGLCDDGEENPDADAEAAANEGDLSPEAPASITPPVATSPGTAAPGATKDTGSIFSSIASGLKAVATSPLTQQAVGVATQILAKPTATVTAPKAVVRTVAAPAKTNYLPWILGGVAVVGLVGLLVYRSKRSASAKPA